jgi:hypothetical protein
MRNGKWRGFERCPNGHWRRIVRISSRLGGSVKRNAFLSGCRFGTFPLPTLRLVPSYRLARSTLEFPEAREVLPLVRPQRRIEAYPHGFLVLRRSVRPSSFKVCNIKAQSAIKKACHDSLKTSSVERTKYFGCLFSFSSPHKLWLFIRWETQASFRKICRYSCLEH